MANIGFMHQRFLLLPCRAMLIRQLKEAQHNTMNVIMSIAEQAIPDSRASRDFRSKYPDDVLLDQINGEIYRVLYIAWPISGTLVC